MTDRFDAAHDDKQCYEWPLVTFEPNKTLGDGRKWRKCMMSSRIGAYDDKQDRRNVVMAIRSPIAFEF